MQISSYRRSCPSDVGWIVAQIGLFGEVDTAMSALAHRRRAQGPLLLHWTLQTLGYSASLQANLEQADLSTSRPASSFPTVRSRPTSVSRHDPLSGTDSARSRLATDPPARPAYGLATSHAGRH
jgi:hypothetical protein